MGLHQSNATVVLVGVGGTEEHPMRSAEGWDVEVSRETAVPQLTLTNARELAPTPARLCGPAGGFLARVPLGVRLALPEAYAAILHAAPAAPGRPAPAYRCANGVIDSGYRGDVAAVLVVLGGEGAVFPPGSVRLCITVLRLAPGPPGLTSPVFRPRTPPACPGGGPPGLTSPVFRPRTPPACPGGAVCYVGEREDIPGTDAPLAGERHAFVPRRPEDAGLDVVARRRVEIPPRDSRVLQPSLRYVRAGGAEVCCFFGRSSLNARGVVVTPSVWRGDAECRFRITNLTDEPFVIEPGSRVAQLVVVERDCSPTWVAADAVGHDADSCPAFRDGGPAGGARPENVPSFRFTASYAAQAPASARGEGGFGSTGV
ncbi:deoxyuridine triphosphatase [Ateline alphaherpesvirus 1]|uniref:Deoxyuridine triphosphatase n=1 Tax=Herpesvirus ateles type 1 (strain Lennette) TaxID=35243 RepID=A0A1S6JLL5_HSVA1|nr:deoxyuridine triphosphatase [Ateline alphaherpesvirus 1]AQS79166.1 deoxyuridine triphosphatase [Ateline alphaherpesvirus 1]